MAGIAKKGDADYCSFRFRFRGHRYYFTAGKVTEAQTRAKATEVDGALDLIELGRLEVPPGVPPEEFVAAGGKIPVLSARPETTTARQLFDYYLSTVSYGTVEDTSLATLRTHLCRVTETLGDRCRIQGMTLSDLQGHVERRRKKSLSPVPTKKEIATFRACWRWAAHGELLKGVLPGRGLRFPKEDEKEPFRTFAEIRSVIATEKPDEARWDALWESLYLTRPEVEEFLEHVRAKATLPWVFPMVAFAAYTGARRSELMRALATDVDLTAGIVTVCEKKRVKGKRSTRMMPVTPKLEVVVRGWLAVRPDSPSLFCQSAQVMRSKNKAGDPDHDYSERSPRPPEANARGFEVGGGAGSPRPEAQFHLGTGQRSGRPAGDRRGCGAPIRRAATAIPAPIPKGHE